MDVPELVPVTDRRWRLGDWVGAGIRALLLLVLIGGAAAVVASLHPVERQQSDLTADLAAGRVTYLEYERGAASVRWSVGPWRWRVTTLTYADSPAVDNTQGDALTSWLYQRVNASGHPVDVHVREDSGSRWWPTEVVWEPLQAATTTAWVLTFLLMLSRTRHRYANRWAWFWLFLIGQIGVLFYLILEPQPIWRPGSWPARARPPIGGWTGLADAILLSIGLSVVLTVTGARVW